MRSGARSGSDGSTSVEAGRRVGASVKSRLAQPPRIVDVFGALRPSVRARWVWRELYANYPSARHGWDGAEQWPWADRSISNRRKPRDSDRDVPSCVVTYPYPAKNISNLVPCLQSGLNQRDRATAGFVRGRSHGKREAKQTFYCRGFGSGGFVGVYAYRKPGKKMYWRGFISQLHSKEHQHGGFAALVGRPGCASPRGNR